MDESLTLIFEPDHPCNTRITKDSWHGELLYVVETEVLHPNKRTITSVRKPNGVLLATFEWKELKSDVITLGGGEPIPAGNWLKKSIIPFNDSVTYKDDSLKALKWKGNAPGLALELYADNDKTKPLARFQKSRRSKSSTTGQSSSAMLILDSRATSSQEKIDLIVVSFLYLEKNRRVRDEDDFSATSAPAKRRPTTSGSRPTTSGSRSASTSRRPTTSGSNK